MSFFLIFMRDQPSCWCLTGSRCVCTTSSSIFGSHHRRIFSFNNSLLTKTGIQYQDSLRTSFPGRSVDGAGKKKDRFELRLWNLNIDLHRKCRCEMLVGGDDISNDIITLGTCFSLFFFFFYISAPFRFALIGGNWTAQLMGSHRGIGGGIQLRGTYLQALLPFPAPPPKRPLELARRVVPG